MRINGSIEISEGAILDFCRRWRVIQLELFGSALRDDFGPESDIDLLVTLEPGAAIDLYDLMAMRDEMAQIVGRPVDLFERAGVEKSKNPYRRQSILSTAQVVYQVA
jgi:predicted nucleotidyltransferase